jgi:hypothetical protein
VSTLLSGCQCANGNRCARGELDKLCQVEMGPIGDSCEALAGQEVTCIYRSFQGCPEQNAASLVTVFDDQFGEDPIFTDVPIGPVDTIELSLSTTIFETTINTARATGNTSNECGAFGIDTVTVVVSSVPTPTPTSSPTPTSTPTATPTPTPTPTPCTGLWPVVEIMTLGKGQSPSNNPKVVSSITGNIIDPNSLGDTAHRIPVCSGPRVDVAVTDTTGSPALTPNSSGISCAGDTCVVMTINATEKYIARSSDGKDTDRVTLLPE